MEEYINLFINSIDGENDIYKEILVDEFLKFLMESQNERTKKQRQIEENNCSENNSAKQS